MLSTIYLIGVFTVIGFSCCITWRRAEDPFDDINKIDTAKWFGILTAFVALLWPVLLIILVLDIIALVIYLSWCPRRRR